jgi:hypothetical protein
LKITGFSNASRGHGGEIQGVKQRCCTSKLKPPFNDLLEHHVSFEDFGENVTRRRDGVIRAGLLQHMDVRYPYWDRMILDTTREKLAEHWVKAHPGVKFPHFIYIWLPDDHTAGLSPCY